jgi:uncharacterized protein (TIGR02246 family)
MATIREITERAIAAFNQHDGATLESLTAPDCVCTAPGDMTFTGPAQIREFMESWFTAFPDGTTTAKNVYYCGDDTSVEEGVFTGTHDGVFHTPMGDIQPTHRKVHGNYVNIVTVAGGKAVSQRLIFDRLQLLEQLGLVPTPAATA